MDRLFAAYLLDLIPLEDLMGVLAEFRRVLKPGGCIALVSMTEVADAASRLLIGAWKAVYRISPVACGGCRPVQLAHLVSELGFQHLTRQVIVQAAIPSEVVLGVRP